MEFLAPKGSNSGVYLMGRYEVQILDSHGKEKVTFGDLGGIYQQWDDNAEPQDSDGDAPSKNAAKPAGEWQSMTIRFRAPRFDEAGGIFEKPVFLSVVVNGEEVQRNAVVHGPAPAHPREGVAAEDAIFIQSGHGAIALSKFTVTEENFSEVPAEVGKTIENRLDLVRYGAETFLSLGCAECHSSVENDPATKTGSSLHGLSQKQPCDREVVKGAETYRQSRPILPGAIRSQPGRRAGHRGNRPAHRPFRQIPPLRRPRNHREKPLLENRFRRAARRLRSRFPGLHHSGGTRRPTHLPLPGP